MIQKKKISVNCYIITIYANFKILENLRAKYIFVISIARKRKLNTHQVHHSYYDRARNHVHLDAINFYSIFVNHLLNNNISSVKVTFLFA